MRRLSRKIKRVIYMFRRFFSNLYRWFPILIRDENFDYYFLFKILNHKLKYMEDFFVNGHTFSIDADKRGKEIKIARILTDRILKEDYSHKYFYSGERDNYKHQDYLKQQDIGYLFDLMKTKILTWWG